MTGRQPLDALANANRVRLARTQLKREIKAGTTDVATVLRRDLPDWLEGITVEELLKAQPGVGKVRVNQLTALASVSHQRRLGLVTHRQRHVLAAALDDLSTGDR